jgi:hypothetical protein
LFEHSDVPFIVSLTMTAFRGYTAGCRTSMPYILHAQGHGKRDSPAMVVTWCHGYLFVIDVPLQLWCRVRPARCAVEAYLFSDLVLLLFPCNVWAVLRKICQTENKPLGCTFRCRAWYKIWRNLRPEGVRGVDRQYCSFIECYVLHSGKRWLKNPDDGGGKFLRILRQFLPEYQASQRRGQ